MGMDLYIYQARNHEVFKHENWWDSNSVTEKFYARKFWSLVENCHFIPYDYEDNEKIKLTKENIEEMIRAACEYRDYFGTYNNVPLLCELRDEFDTIEEDGYHLYLSYSS